MKIQGRERNTKIDENKMQWDLFKQSIKGTYKNVEFNEKMLPQTLILDDREESINLAQKVIFPYADID